MAFEFGMVKEILSRIMLWGFDRFTAGGGEAGDYNRYYLDDALVFDEKVSSSQAFSAAKEAVGVQPVYLFQAVFGPAFVELSKGNASYFNLAVYAILLPRLSFHSAARIVLISFIISMFWGWAAWRSGACIC